VFVLPIGEHRFKVGSTYDWKDLSENTSVAGKKLILERLNNLITTDFRVLNHQAGIRPTVIDRRPILGRHPEFSNIFVFNGLGTKGVMVAPYFAKQMLHCISKPNFSINPEVDVQRFYTRTD
jgi:glycine/D-amino acid oxidase-like deaminating enzyme